MNQIYLMLLVALMQQVKLNMHCYVHAHVQVYLMQYIEINMNRKCIKPS